MRAEAWSDDDVRLLRKLWAAGETAEAIATKLEGMSRSAVLGKVFRLRLPAAPGVAKARAGTAAVRPAKDASLQRRRGLEPEPLAEPKAERKGRSLFELTNDCCRWPYRRPGTEKYFFCGAAGADLENGLPYCPRHMKRAYLVPPPRVVQNRPAYSFAARRKRGSAG